MSESDESKVSSVIEWIRRLFQRRSLRLYAGQVTDCDSLETIFQSCVNSNQLEIASLCIRKTSLTTVPQNIGIFQNIASLDLSHNFLEELPWSVVYLSQLKRLNLSYNRLTILPLTVGCLVTLTSLYLDFNQLKYLPKCLLNLTRLQTMTLDGNEMITPSTKICSQGVQAIFQALRQLEARRNLWDGWNPNMTSAGKPVLLSLTELCYRCVRDHSVNFLMSAGTPPRLKRELMGFTEGQDSELNLMKCSNCKKFFSNTLNFKAHYCIK